jgi:hypothetical protein
MFEEMKFKLTLAKKFVYSIESQAQVQAAPKKTGGKTQKRRRIKNRYTRRQY